MEAMMSAEAFAQATWGGVQLGDRRLNRRAVQIGACMAAHPEGSLPMQMQDPAALEGAYRLMNNRLVQMQALLEPVYQQTRQLAEQVRVVLWVNDQTELDYTRYHAKRGLGPIGNEQGRGLLMHSTLAVVPETREVLGLGYLQIYLRQLARKPRAKYVQTPESQCWTTGTRAMGQAPAGCTWVMVSDAGSDYFDYLAACVEAGKGFLVRVSRERWLRWAEGEAPPEPKLIAYARSLPPQPGSQTAVAVPARHHQPARPAQVVMAWAAVTLAPSPQAPPALRRHPPLPAWVLRVWEPEPPEGVAGLEWILLSSLPVTNLTQAQERTEWYSCRWLCEDFHQCLKTGCQVEHSQLDDRADLERLIGFAAPIAVRLLQLRQAARQAPQQLAQAVVDPLMLAILARRQRTDSQTMTLDTFWRLVARLGGFQGRKGDGEPGWRTIWRGWHYLSDLTDGARLVTQT